MIIQCPNCGRRFNLQRRPPQMFRCPKCLYSAPFSEILNAKSEEEKESEEVPANETQVVQIDGGEKTKFVEGLGGGMKTAFVPGLQATKTAFLQITYNGMNYGTIRLPQGSKFYLGRKSSDSTAQIKLAPDITMSRVHAVMRTVRARTGETVYQVTSMKQENPVFVNGRPIAKGMAYNLKSGDILKMGETTAAFKLM